MVSILVLSSIILWIPSIPVSAESGGTNNSEATDWPTFSADAANTGHLDTSGPTNDVNERWNKTVGSVSAAASVVDETVYVGSNDNNIYAVFVNNGTERWKYSTTGSIGTAPAVVNDTVYVGSNDGGVYALDVDTGTQRWRYDTGDLVRSSPTVVNDTVYIGSNDGNVYALNASTGSQKWTFTTGDKVTATPAVVNDTVYVGSEDNEVYALNASTGNKRWNVTTGFYVSSSPAIVDDTVYVASADGKVYALDADTGAEQWNFSTGAQIQTSPAVTDGTVYVSGGPGDNSVYAIDAKTGTQQWRYITNNVLSSPAIVDGTVYVGSGDSKVYAFYANNGTERWNFTTGKFVSASPVVVNGTLYIGSTDDNLYALSGSSSGSESGTDSMETESKSTATGTTTTAKGGTETATETTTASNGGTDTSSSEDDSDNDGRVGQATFAVPAKVISEERGDVASISIQFSNTDQATLRLGSEQLNYDVEITVEDNGDGIATVRWNTHFAGVSNPDRDVFRTADSADSVTAVKRLTAPDFDGTRRLGADAYPMSLSVAGTETDVGTVSLRDPASVQRSLAVGSARRSSASESVPDKATYKDERSIAEGDWIVLRIQTAGIHGYIDSSTNLSQGVDGVSLSITETSVESGETPDTVDPATFELQRYSADNRLVLYADTGHSDFQLDERYRVNYTIDASTNPYLRDTFRTSASFVIEPRNVSIDAPVEAGEVVVSAASGQSIRGSTNLADGTQVNLTVRSTGDNVAGGQPFLRTSGAVIQQGTFNTAFDFSTFVTNQRFTVSVHGPVGAQTSRNGVVKRTATVRINDQLAQQAGTLVVDSVYLPSGGFVSIHDQQSLQAGDSTGSVIGTSGYLKSGQYADVRVRLDSSSPLNKGSTGITAMVHRDTDDNRQYGFVATSGQEDGPYVLNGNPVTDSASIVVSSPTPTASPTPTPSPTRTPTPTPTPTATPTPTMTTTTQERTTTTDNPGFGPVVTLLAIVLIVVLAYQRGVES